MPIHRGTCLLLLLLATAVAFGEKHRSTFEASDEIPTIREQGQPTCWLTRAENKDLALGMKQHGGSFLVLIESEVDGAVPAPSDTSPRAFELESESRMLSLHSLHVRLQV